MTCQYLKQVVMLYCDACHVKKMVPLDHLVSASPCLLPDHVRCPLYVEVMTKLGELGEDVGPTFAQRATADGSGKEAFR